jgi:hypothetical protein
MPTIKFKLKDPKYCNGCRFHIGGGMVISEPPKCELENYLNMCHFQNGTKGVCTIRPAACKDKYGD